MLFLDLDVVVVGSIDGFFDFESGKLALIRDWSATVDRQFLGHARAGGGGAAPDRRIRGRAVGKTSSLFQRAGLSDARIASADGVLAHGMVPRLQSHDVAAFSRQSCQEREIAGRRPKSWSSRGIRGRTKPCEVNGRPHGTRSRIRVCAPSPGSRNIGDRDPSRVATAERVSNYVANVKLNEDTLRLPKQCEYKV